MQMKREKKNERAFATEHLSIFPLILFAHLKKCIWPLFYFPHTGRRRLFIMVLVTLCLLFTFKRTMERKRTFHTTIKCIFAMLSFLLLTIL